MRAGSQADRRSSQARQGQGRGQTNGVNYDYYLFTWGLSGAEDEETIGWVTAGARENCIR